MTCTASDCTLSIVACDACSSTKSPLLLLLLHREGPPVLKDLVMGSADLGPITPAVLDAAWKLFVAAAEKVWQVTLQTTHNNMNMDR